ncbi:lipopolysaccharide assembly protein LapB [Spirabiliibacterium falconis]|uniref:lipopolysaccharide assembly protein LapB n=1 Tax=Spirabiliibacterium falconis TaxID=572023 RepID=UPI001AADCB68|nr:lipopolysaccharide assembly protein LapB [Spirabiliibacterium falconis]MBE2894208.1 lipopolysaccharide assembly protein LapB [Spirabiliibacterium falconis]
MLELLFLLLPIAALYGWYMGYRSARKGQDDVRNKLSQDYVTGVNLLLSNQQDKAVGLFLDMLQKQEAENEIDSASQFEASLTLGNLFRTRGEVDRAIRIHQNLLDDVNLIDEQKLLVKQQLAFDYVRVGFFDRAENLYISLIDEPEYAENALKELAKIYQKMKEWKKAIDVTEKRQKAFPKPNNVELAHYYCEYIAAQQPDDKEKTALLQKALSVSPSCARASLELGFIAMREHDFTQAISYFEQILVQNPVFISEALVHLHWCYSQLSQLDNFELFLIKARQSVKSGQIELALADIIEKKSGEHIAQTHLYEQLSHIPSMDIFQRLLQYDLNSMDNDNAKSSLSRLQQIVSDKIEKNYQYHCTNCGYHSHRLLWNCPSCNQWESIKPTDGIYQKNIQ